MQKTAVIIIVLVVAGLGAWYLMGMMPKKPATELPKNDYKNTSYTIDGATVTLKSGSSQVEAAPGSASVTTTLYFGNEVMADLNGDGAEDLALLLTQDTGGSGVFYYVVAALKTATGYTGTNAILLGDRIAPQTTEYRDGKIIVNYADRKQGEPMTADPSMGVSKYLKLENGALVEVAP